MVEQKTTIIAPPPADRYRGYQRRPRSALLATGRNQDKRKPSGDRHCLRPHGCLRFLAIMPGNIARKITTATVLATGCYATPWRARAMASANLRSTST